MRLLLVEWLDSHGPPAGWQEIDEQAPGPAVCRSVGWALHDRRDSITLLPHMIDGTERIARVGRGELTIPRRAIVSIRTLAVPGARMRGRRGTA